MNEHLIIVIVAFFTGLIIVPVATRHLKEHVSPYPKADLKQRFIALIIDVGIVVACYTALSPNNITLAAIISPVYLLIRDGLFRGQSFGKLWVGLMVIQIESGRPVRIVESLRRNFLFIVPGVNLSAGLLEMRQILTDEQGMRLGDRFAKTQVVHGKDSVELLKTVVDVLQSFRREVKARFLPERIKNIDW
ncbi:MAG: RDD family protein [Acidobacteriota bacterium]|jgi:uncharacterized RDD family membrane protein YckC